MTSRVKPRNKAMMSAWNKGRAARIAGEPRANPYPDKRGGLYDHTITFSRAFQKCWNAGWDEADAELPS